MFKNLSSRQVGFIQIILSGMCFGALGFFGKMAYRVSVGPGELLALRYSISAIFMGLTILFTNPKSFILTRFQLISSLLLGICGYALFSSFFFIALTGLSASLTVLLLYTYPVMVAVLSQFILKEHLGKKGVMALGLASVGMIGLVWGELSISDPKFLLYGVGAAFFYSIYIMYSRKYLSDVPAMPSSFYVQLGAGTVLSLIHFHNFERPVSIVISHPAIIIGMAIICSFMAMTLFLAGLRRITSSEASILSTTEPLFGVLIAAMVLEEKLSMIQISGGVLILIAMVLLALSKEKQKQEF
ncbi:DMT family transporter [Bacteriovorax sp. PP10]|uniref:DMT family transporter n=1 Tax=Bacteriovorax antarcticus TaxID=3088717 RepID=A0ABU5VWR2_9BACT|nr:DMT family transporter [Bacteriovorax sp. PP10]MEA9357499.1 DMT family transporter [Bacteriovorax sp. PP10]